MIMNERQKRKASRSRLLKSHNRRKKILEAEKPIIEIEIFEKMFEALLDNVFDTVNRKKEVLSFEEIKSRVDSRFVKKTKEKDLKEHIAFMVGLGYYKEVIKKIKGTRRVGIKYIAGMPKAMNGSFRSIK